MAPSQVNDAVRQIMRKVKQYYLDTSGFLTTGGTGSAYTLATHEVFTAYVDGLTVGFRVHASNTGGPTTLALDGLGAKPLQSEPGVDLHPGELQMSRFYRAMYIAGTDAFRLMSAPARLDAPAGTRMLFQQTAAPLGWVKELGAAFGNTALRISTGAVGSGGSLLFDTAFAQRTILQANLPNVSFFGATDLQNAHSHTGTTDSQGAHGHSGFTGIAGSHSHTPSGGGQFEVETGAGGSGTAGGTGRNLRSTTSADGDHAHTIALDGAHAHNLTINAVAAHGHNVVTSSGGSGTPMDFRVAYHDVIIAQKA
jgi:hypothetical protein